MKPRSGFTLIELLVVIVIIGILAAIITNRFWQIKERTYKTAMLDGLRTAAVQQERYYYRYMTYANNSSILPDFKTSPNVTVTVTWSSNAGWAAISAHAGLPLETCGFFTGPAPAGIAPPATVDGRITCD